ncbi:telomeric repeat-binding factor 1 [Cololabis saira]|uniref:telomeric repeat-binding factor 1 n=1 Tax=Cololabis saira TaxID=129043 RepID=UPI002AD59321|nr:telomeric repeat-binding factor 1 [Cololabis saira]
MDCESSEEPTSSDNDTLLETASFCHVTAVATGWMMDFMFVSLCRSFQEGKLEEFNETLSAFQAISQTSSLKGNVHNDKMLICALLARVMHGKELDVLFEEDDSVMPLMSALKIWSDLEHIVTDESLFKNIIVLLSVQSVAVCLEKGQRSSASSALKWLEKQPEFPRNVRVKLSTIVTQRETYHPLLMSFSFNRLLETIQSFLDAYLEKNPSDYLLKAATKMVQSLKNFEGSEEAVSVATSVSETPNESKQENKKTKRKLLSTKITDVWKPETADESCVTANESRVTSVKPHVTLRRLSKTELSQMISRKPLETAEVQNARRPHRKWTYQHDMFLKEGVRRHGLGKWSQILLDYDFDGRTNTMLKDRWRVLVRSDKVC